MTTSPPPGLLGDSRGLTAAGAAVLVGIGASVGALIDLNTGTGLRAVFAVLFVGSCLLAAARVHREDLLASMIIPPLIYLAITIIGAYAQPPSGGAAHGLKQNAIDVGTSLVLTAPVLLVATGVAVAVALRRGRRYVQQR